MRRGRAALLLLTGAVTAAAAEAQAHRSWELGALGQYTRFPVAIDAHSGFGAGGMVDWFFAQRTALELDAAWTPTKTRVKLPTRDVQAVSIHLSVARAVPIAGRTTVVVSGGYGLHAFRKGLRETLHGAAGAVTVREGLGPHLALRLAGTLDWVWSGASGAGGSSRHPLLLGARAALAVASGSGGAIDSDRDGVPGTSDRCPRTPPGESVDPNGCSASQRDTDGDGVRDNMDRCPQTPPGERPVNREGCSVSQQDDDRDGVMNGRDQCPGTPAGEAVGGNGCSDSQRDSDGDGVVDRADRCPGTPAGTPVDQNGCPRPPTGPRGAGAPALTRGGGTPVSYLKAHSAAVSFSRCKSNPMAG